jgi:purine nucleoside permease
MDIERNLAIKAEGDRVMATEKKTTDGITAIVDAADEVKSTLAALNAALKKAHRLNINVVVVKETVKYDFSRPTVYGQKPNTVPVAFKLTRLDYELK